MGNKEDMQAQVKKQAEEIVNFFLHTRPWILALIGIGFMTLICAIFSFYHRLFSSAHYRPYERTSRSAPTSPRIVVAPITTASPIVVAPAVPDKVPLQIKPEYIQQRSNLNGNLIGNPIIKPAVNKVEHHHTHFIVNGHRHSTSQSSRMYQYPSTASNQVYQLPSAPAVYQYQLEQPPIYPQSQQQQQPQLQPYILDNQPYNPQCPQYKV